VVGKVDHCIGYVSLKRDRQLANLFYAQSRIPPLGRCGQKLRTTGSSNTNRTWDPSMPVPMYGHLSSSK
jgi:hypothetical protein